jgi:hypothetical protein
MPMPAYPVLCYRPGCGRPARFKIAARWSDGVTEELKTYALSCEACLAAQFAASKAKQAACRLAPGETLDVPGIYELARGSRDTGLVRRHNIEEELSATSAELPSPP